MCVCNPNLVTLDLCFVFGLGQAFQLDFLQIIKYKLKKKKKHRSYYDLQGSFMFKFDHRLVVLCKHALDILSQYFLSSF